MKKIKTILRITICLSLLLFTTSTINAQKEERKNVREGNKLYKSEKFTEAEISYRKGLEVNPRSIEGTYNLGNSLYKQKKFQEAAEQYQMIIGQGERLLQTAEGMLKLSNVFHNMGDISMQSKEYAKSVEAYKQSLRMNPGDDETRYNLALAQKLLENQQQENQDQDKNKDEEQQKDQNKDQQDQQQQQQQDQEKENDKQDKTQEQPQQNEQMSKDNAQQMLDAFLQDEKNTQEKVKKAQAQQQQRRKSDKEW